MKLIVGLGNPGKEYEKTRHNVGWLFVEYLEKRYQFTCHKKAFESLIAETTIKGEKVVVMKPLTFMNLSGNAVQKAKQWYKVENTDILVIYDDIDIPFGTVRFRSKGSAGTHNGMKHIVQMLKGQDIARIRIGIGGLKHEKQELYQFVLERFSKKELEVLEEILMQAETKLEEFLDKSDEKC